MSYHADGASWRPLYDLTLDGERLAVSYLAEVKQQTGEDWPATELVLSTTRRGLHESLPELSPWYIGRARPVPLPAVRLRSMARTPMAAEGAPATVPAPQQAMAAAAPYPGGPPARPPEAEHLTAESGRVGRRPGVPGPAPAGGARRRRAVQDDGGQVRARCGPGSPGRPGAGPRGVRAGHRHQHLVAAAAARTGPRSSTAPSSSGRPRWRPWPRARSSSCSSGWMTRSGWSGKLRRRSTSKAMLGGTRTIDVAYEITVENHRRPRPGSACTTTSRCPRTGRSRCGSARPARTRPARPTWASSPGTWCSTPGETAAIRYRFTVEHPAQVTVTGL